MARILLLGADRRRTGGVRSILRQDGHLVSTLRNPEEWRAHERHVQPEIVVATVEAAESVLGAAGRAARGFPAPLLFVRGDEDLPSGAHLDDRLVDEIQSPFLSEELLGRVDALVRARRTVLRTTSRTETVPDAGGKLKRSAGTVARLGGRLAALLGTRVPKLEKPLGPYLEVAARIAEWSDQRDVFAPGHAERVTSFAAMIADGLRLPSTEASSLLRAAMLHDIGKVALPVEVLRRKGPLDDDQRRMIRTHPERGASLLRALDDDDEVAQAILYHHEQPDGAGYYGRSPDSIPRSAAILGVAEAYDAMTSTTLQQPMTSNEALSTLQDMSGSKFNGECVDALTEALKPAVRTLPLSS